MSKLKVLAMEGQFNLPIFVKMQLIKPFAQKHPGVIEVTHAAWHQWSVYYKYDWDIVIGHSLGGGAVIEFAKRNPEPVFISLDPRHMSNSGWVDTLIPFIVYPTLGSFNAPNGARIHNFHRNGYMPGYKVVGAESEVQLNCTHFTVPRQPEVFQRLETIVNGLLL